MSKDGKSIDACPRGRARGGWSRLDNELVTRGMWASLSDIEARVFIALLVHANEHRECWPSLATLARETGRHWTAISGAVHRLAERGLIEIRRGKRRTNEYSIHPYRKVMKTFSAGTNSVRTKEPIALGLKGVSARTKGPIALALTEAEAGKQIQETDTKKQLACQASSERIPSVKKMSPSPEFTTWWTRAQAVLNVKAASAVTATTLYDKALRNGHSPEELLRALDGAAVKLQRPEPFRLARDPRWVLSPEGIEDCLEEAEKPRRRESGRKEGRRREPEGFTSSTTSW